MNDDRPDPESLLRRIQAEERESSEAKLKLFFGAYPGVGKTYAMLQAARERKQEDVDVVIGVVETHGRPETAALVNGLETLARKEIPYKGVILREFDLDAALARKPDLILIDELAHSNPLNSRHAKRWQDVEELLNAGISVYTTLNVQHWESLNDVVAQITGIKVRETVPDNFLERAREVELVDLPPGDLLKRMSEGKVYAGDQAIRAAENFFQVGNLIALRELALRHTAEHVDAEMQEFKSRYAIARVLPVRERLLVGITASPHSQRLVRATLRLATSLRCEWITMYVQTPEHERLPSDQKARIIDTLRLAERLGGETVMVAGQDVADEMLRFARSRNVTKIVVGKPSQPRWREWLFGSKVNVIARQSGEIDLYVISASGIPDETFSRRVPGQGNVPREGIRQAILLAPLCTLVCWALLPYLDRANLLMLYFPVVVWLSYRYGRPSGIIGSVLSVVLFDFFLVPPYLTFRVSDTEYFITFAVMLAVALFISTLTGRLASMAQATRGQEARLRTLYKLSRTLSEIPEPQVMLQAACEQLGDFYHMPVLLMTPDASGKLRINAGDPESFGFAGNETTAAEWVFHNGEIAGRGSDTLSGCRGTYIPLRGREQTVGVMGIQLGQEAGLIEPEQMQLMETFAVVIAGALESKELSEAAGKATASMEAERIKNLVLRSFSFDLAAPSQEIVEAAGKLLQSGDGGLSEAASKKTLETIRDRSDLINRVVARLPQYLAETVPAQPENASALAEMPEMKLNVPLSRYLEPGRILFFPLESAKKEILKRLIGTLQLPDQEEALRLITEREEVGGILIKPNVAIPHATIDSISGVRAALGIQQREADGPFFWLVFISGSESMQEHLEFLKSAAQSFTDEFMETLSRAGNAERALKILSVA